MPVVNHVKKEINVKLVYAGIRGAGKKTSLAFIHGRLRPDSRGDIRKQGNDADSLMFFDFLPREIGSVDGYHVRFHVYAVAVGEENEAALRMVLKGVDGIMFVADASPGAEELNSSALLQVESALSSHGVDMCQLPVVIQCNKADRVDARSSEATQALSRRCRTEAVETVAPEGKGVLAAVSLLVKKVMQDIRRTGVQFQEPELPEQESAEDDEWGDEQDILSSPYVSGEVSAMAGGWNVTILHRESECHNGVMKLPLRLSAEDGRSRRLVLSITLTEEGTDGSQS